MADIRSEIASVLNRHCRENKSNTPDWILAEYLLLCLDAFDSAVNARASWYGRMDEPGQSNPSEIPNSSRIGVEEGEK